MPAPGERRPERIDGYVAALALFTDLAALVAATADRAARARLAVDDHRDAGAADPAGSAYSPPGDCSATGPAGGKGS